MGGYLSNLNPTSGRKRNHSQAEVDDTDESDVQRSSKRRKLKSTSEYIYYTLFVNGENSDVTISAIGREWRLHKVYLCQSGFFSSMFSGTWRESSMSRVELDIPDEYVSVEALTTAFGSFYRDDITLDPSTVQNVLAAASLLSLDDLIQQCADVMLDSIDMNNVCSYYAAGRLYGAKDVPEKCIKFLHGSLMASMTVRLLKDIEPDLMMKLVESTDFIVLQVEMDVYSMLRKWLYLRLNSTYEGSLKDLLRDTDAFFKSEAASNWKPSFLDTAHGEPYIGVFSKLRIEHIITDYSSAKILETDDILPRKWLLNCYKSQWLQLLKIDNGQDIGPKDIDVEIFERKSMRCGRKLDTEGQYCWRWTGFNYGVDILVSCLNHRVYIKRNTPSDHCRCVLAPHVRKNMVCRLTVSTASGNCPAHTLTTGIKHLSLCKDEEICVLTLDRNMTFPLYFSCNFLVYTPHLEAPKEPSVADVAAVGNTQPVAGPSGLSGFSFSC